MTPAPKPLARRVLPALAALGVAALLATAGWHGYTFIAAQPLKRVVFAGDLDRLPQAELEALTQAVQSAGRSPIGAVREAAMRMPWVRDATVRRIFPDAVEITFEAHQAFARWNDTQLVSRRGEVFTATDAATLPWLRGPEGTVSLLVAELPGIAAVLAPLGSPLAQLRLTPRGAWEATLADGLVLALGRGEHRTRAERFARAWPLLSREARAARYADLRYPNGFALRTTSTPSPALPPGGGSTQ